SYAAKYATDVPTVIGSEFWRTTLDTVVGPNVLLWIVPWAGALLMWWEQRLGANQRFFLTALLLCSFASIGVGLYFRQHYFITLLPALALLTGVAVSRSLRLLKHDKTIELFLALPILGLFVLGALASLIGNGSVWFGMSPTEASSEIYQANIYTELRKAGQEVGENSKLKTQNSKLNP